MMCYGQPFEKKFNFKECKMLLVICLKEESNYQFNK